MKEQKMFDKVAVTLAPAQLLEKGKLLAEKRAAITKLEEEKGDALKTFNDKLHTMEAESADLAREINDGQTEKDIEIVEEPDDGRKLMIIKEASSGRMLKTRKMTLEEIGDSEFRLNGGASNGASDTDPPPAAEKTKGRKGRRAAAAETTEEASE
jgi:hypothetical protein